MKKDYDKRVFHFFSIYHTDEIEAYLTKMAGNGYFLLEMNDHQMFFQKVKECKVRYRVILGVNRFQKWEEQKYREQLGWSFVCEGQNYQIYKTEDMQLEEMDSDSYRYHQVKSLRNKALSYHIAIIALIIGVIYGMAKMEGGFFLLWFSSIIVCLMTVGFVTCLLLLMDIIDTVVWKWKSERIIFKLSQTPLYFQNSRVAKCIKRVLLILISITSVILFYIAASTYVQSVVSKGWNRNIFLVIYVGVFSSLNIFFSIRRGENSKRGYLERKVIELCFLIGVVIIASAVVSETGKQSEINITPTDYFQETKYSDKTSEFYIEKGQSIVGSKESVSFVGFNEEESIKGSYEYYLYESKFPIIQTFVKKEALKTLQLQSFLTQADWSKLEKESAVLNLSLGSTYEGNTIFGIKYDNCIILSSESKLLIFYYKDFDNSNLETLIKLLEKRVL